MLSSRRFFVLVATGLCAGLSGALGFNLQGTAVFPSLSTRLQLAKQVCLRTRSGTCGNQAIKCIASNESPVGLQSRRQLLDTLLLTSTAAAISFTPTALFAAKEELATSTEEIEGSDGLLTKVSFSYPRSWKYDRDPGPVIFSTALRDACLDNPDKCVFGDMIARSVASGDNAFVTGFVSNNAAAQDIPAKTILSTVFGKYGKFGAYGAPDEVKVMSDKSGDGLRTIEVKFNSFSPGGNTILKRSLLSIPTAGGAGPDVYVLVATTTGSRYKAAQETLMDVARSFKIEGTGKAADTGTNGAGAGVRKSMFAKENEERARMQQERAKEGLY